MHSKNIWRPASLSKLTPIIINMELTHLGSKTTIYIKNNKVSLTYQSILTNFRSIFTSQFKLIIIVIEF